MALNYIQADERLVGDGHAAYADTLNRPLKDLVAKSGAFNVRHYGATGDGTTDDTVAIQAAIDAAAAAPAGVVYFPPGLYIVTQLVMRGGVALQGNSSGRWTSSALKLKDGVAVDAMIVGEGWVNGWTGVGSPIRVRHLAFLGNRSSGATGRGIILFNWDSNFEQIHMEEFSSDCVYLPRANKAGQLLTNSSVVTRFQYCTFRRSGGRGIYGDDTASRWTDGWLVDCHFSELGEDAIDISAGSGWYLRGNHIWGTKKGGIRIRNAGATEITENYVESYGREGTGGTYTGIHVHCWGPRGANVSHNKVYNSLPGPSGTYYGITMQPATDTTAPIVCESNILHGDGTGAAFYVYISSNATLKGTVVDNEVSNWGTVVDGQSANAGENMRWDRNSWQIGTERPQSGRHFQGTIAWNTATDGGKPVFWVCRIGGNPGTWRPGVVLPNVQFAGDTDITLTPYVSGPTVRFGTTLTANRVITLDTTGVTNGAKFRITRTAGGAFTLNVGGLKNLAAGQWCDVEWDGVAWQLTAFGSL